MPAKGCIQVPNPVTEDVLRAIASLGDHEVFTIKDVAARSGRDSAQVRCALHRKSRQGAIERVARGKYRKGGTRIKSRTPHGLIAEAVFMVLFTAKAQDLPMRSPQIVGEVETLIGRTVPLASMCTKLTLWHRDGHLERTGKYREYAYRLKPGITERPVTKNPNCT